MEQKYYNTSANCFFQSKWREQYSIRENNQLHTYNNIVEQITYTLS